MPIVNFSADAANGTISVTTSANNLSTAFFTGAQEASARLAISDGNNSVTSDYIPMAVKAGTFGINSKETLIEFASRATMLHPLTRAEVVADIDMTGYDWTPIEGFGADYIFDG